MVHDRFLCLSGARFISVVSRCVVDVVEGIEAFTESLILAQDERWRRA